MKSTKTPATEISENIATSSDFNKNHKVKTSSSGFLLPNSLHFWHIFPPCYYSLQLQFCFFATFWRGDSIDAFFPSMTIRIWWLADFFNDLLTKYSLKASSRYINKGSAGVFPTGASGFLGIAKALVLRWTLSRNEWTVWHLMTFTMEL